MQSQNESIISNVEGKKQQYRNVKYSEYLAVTPIVLIAFIYKNRKMPY